MDFRGRIWLAWLLGLALAGLFWWPLVTGGGFVGGDIYSYYFPQKVFYAEQLSAGHLPTWNDRVGHGYPVLAESQTGVFYPLHLAMYSWLEVNTAYSLSHVLHYVLAFVFTVGFARRFGLSMTGACLAGLVFVYGWFPSRSCWEWAITGGAWLPAALWAVEGLLQTRRWRCAGLLSLILATQMLAGHFQLAWITQLVLVIYVPCRLWWIPVEGSRVTGRVRLRAGTLLLLSGLLSIGLASVQLLPTWQFRQQSQRAEAGVDHPLQFGSIPAWYWSQALMPFKWYSPVVDRNAALQQDPAIPGVASNVGEAHLYFGLAPLLLAVLGIADAFRRGDPRGIFWMLLGVFALFFTTGRLVPLVAWLPGFSFFQGPGRYGVVVTLAVAMLSGNALGRVLAPERLTFVAGLTVAAGALLGLGSTSWLILVTWTVVEQARLTPPHWLPSISLTMTLALLLVAGVAAGVYLASSHRQSAVAIGRRVVTWSLGLTVVCDLWLVSHLIQFTDVLADPPIAHLSESPVREAVERDGEPTRVFAPMANFPTVLGMSATPVYFTFGPSEYTRRDLMMPQPRVEDPNQAFVPQTDEQWQWLEQAGVTHILSFHPIDPEEWPVAEVWRGRDPVMNPALRHPGPLYLYRMLSGRGRAALEGQSSGNRVVSSGREASTVTYEVEIQAPTRLVITELMASGWSVEVDGQPREAEVIDGMYRGVSLEPGDRSVRWCYRAPGLYWGTIASLLSLLVWATVGHVRFWTPRWLSFLDLEVEPEAKVGETT